MPDCTACYPQPVPGRLATTGRIMLCAVIFVAGLLSGCSNDCEQDYLPPETVSTSQSAYTTSYLTTDLGVGYTRWENRSTGEAGYGTVTSVYECVPFVGCGDWKRVSNTIPLMAGINIVYVFTESDGCEWRDDYEITQN